MLSVQFKTAIVFTIIQGIKVHGANTIRKVGDKVVLNE